MTPSDSASAFAEYAEFSEEALRRTPPGIGIGAMLKFYCAIRSDYPLVHDSDMLLYEWGTFDFGCGPSFQIGITRQFIEANPEDEQGLMSQLHLTFHFTPSLSSEFGRGSRWCKSRSDLDAFAAFVRSTPPYMTLSDSIANRVELDWDYV
jgi:hypothetical protein